MRPESARAPNSSDEPAGGLALTGVVDPPSGVGGVDPSSGVGEGGFWNKGPLLKLIFELLINLIIEILLLHST